MNNCYKLFVVFLVTSTATHIQACTSPWVSIGSGSSKGCFLFVQDRMDWDNARSHCQRNDGDLVVLETESKRVDLINYMDSNGLRNRRSRHLGANDRSGSWRWLNENSVTNGWRQYNDIQPDNDRGDDTCMYLYNDPYPYGRYDLLSDGPCTTQRYFICEKVKYTSTDAVVPKCGYVNRSTKIVGGEETEIHEYPWQVGLFSTLFRSSPAFFCGGSIINEKWILTAAHCFKIKWLSRMNPRNTFVDVGEHDWTTVQETNATKRYVIEEILKNPNYNPDTLDSDIALIKLASRLSFDPHNKVAPICPPSINELYGRVDAIVTGWGQLSSGGRFPRSLMEVKVTTMANSKCKSDYQGMYTITDNMLCAGVYEGGKDSCEGDSGGPLITADGPIYRQIGVVSFGMGCAIARYPGVYVRITSQWNWITTSISPTIWG